VKDCCEVRVDVPERQRRLLWIVLCINGAMFLVELIAGITARSTALLADSVDMLGDAIVGSLALAANTVCLVMLWRRRDDDVNMRSAWMCSLNDVAGNAGVIVAGAAVALTASGWPDLLVGLLIAGMFCASAASILGSAAARAA